ncbi:guanylate kinase [Saccharibacter sp. 17.LH.SD]|uniref:guanylate kinase n=1 Tax=Saccharibacter sp. 17.LH.SD TaxID=2689393 RepID=UPI0013690E6A|nr:guanylate kinase [Saccharibacter sp. 17.LH.SD]MXV45216.1 guanylate kinase [Saccharibacter sp. 17.LH.SD]
MRQSSRRGVCLVISAPSGAGKSTIAQALRQRESRLFTSISVTTRAPRPGEEEGVHYYFRDMEIFRQMAQQGDLLEWAEVFGRGYGTPRKPIEQALAAGEDIVLDIDWQGYRLMKKALPEDVEGLFVLPPSLEELEKRLRGRDSDSEEEIAKRMKAAMSEISHWREFEHVVINEDLEQAVDDAQAILRAARMLSKRRSDIAAHIAQWSPEG